MIWNRHSRKCEANGNITATGTVCAKCLGSGPKAQRDLYAFRVAQAVTGDYSDDYSVPCVLGGPRVYVAAKGGNANVDRVTPGTDYAPGLIITVSSVQNQRRGDRLVKSQTRYTETVLRVSESVPVPTVSEASEWWRNRPTEAPADVDFVY